MIASWERGGYDVRQYLSGWFWLSDGWYWLDTSNQDIPVSHPDFVESFGLSQDSASDMALYLDYYVGRIWFDLMEIVIPVLEPLPELFVAWVTAGSWNCWVEKVQAWWLQQDQESALDELVSDNLNIAKRWWNARHLDMGYLSAGPSIWFWRTGGIVTLEWDTRACFVSGVLCWVESNGRQTFSVSEFKREVSGFRDRLAADMRDRILEVEALNLLSQTQVEDLWRQHEKSLSQEGRWEGADWAEIHAAVLQLEILSGISMEQCKPI